MYIFPAVWETIINNGSDISNVPESNHCKYADIIFSGGLIMTQKKFLPILILAVSALLIGCSSNPVSKQTRTDLTAEHVRGLYADMDRNDVEDLLGKSDSALAENESFEMYSLADGTSAVLRYAGDKLQAAYIRGKDNVEEALFSNYQGKSTIDDGTTGNNAADDNGAAGNTADDNGTAGNTTDDNGTTTQKRTEMNGTSGNTGNTGNDTAILDENDTENSSESR